ncbi:hypothetical protein AYO20_05343 [Fonsecaea nubica]|uniref:Major facilitator superfamily (MFS) profile domain-containing protein n=1 Tax=Fonsecaea nubica TaxID=856822 RepID=A0A178D1B9_9EURO|nr:hypothetical protein AYO20_05343 [Fonsecaea nubica]OAL35292.1 hypothetical protein AYO20_05343 [Fonsecaea nubica]
MAESVASGQAVTKLSWFRLNNPSVQIILSAACIALNPGIYLALALLGAGGGQPSSATMANIANATAYGVFALSAPITGSILNKVGPRIFLVVACTGYPIFSGSLWYYLEHGHLWFPVVAAVYQGLAGTSLWTSAVYMCNGYAEEHSKAFWRSVQWIFNMLGAAIGASVGLGITWDSIVLGVPKSVYITFVILQCSIASFGHVRFRDSIRVMGKLLCEWRTLLLLPVMFSPEFFFPFQANINAYAFNLRTRNLNTLLNTLFQFPVTAIHTWIIDRCAKSRRRRLFVGVTVNCVWVTGAYIAQSIWLNSWDFNWKIPGPEIDCTDKAYRGAVVVYLFYAAQYGMFQSLVLYVLGSFTNDPVKTAAYGGMYTGVLSAGAAVSFGINASLLPFENVNGEFFAISTLCRPILYFVVWKTATETSYGTEEDVIVPVHIRQEMGIGDDVVVHDRSEKLSNSLKETAV